LDIVLEAHGSVKNVQRIDGADYRRYIAAAWAYDVARQAYLKAALKREVEEFFQEDHSSDHRCQSDNSKEGRGDAVSRVLTDTLPSTYDEMIMPDFSSGHRVAIANDDLSLIAPGLRGPVERHH
jgi:hypothetical protein